MQCKLFNDNWQVHEKTSNFGMSNTSCVQTVTLPHDAMLSCNRTSDATSGNKKGYYPNKAWEYTKTFYVPAELSDKHICFEFEGVYRQAMVYINGDYAGQNSSGYTGFIIDADRFLRYGSDNELKVTCKTADDSRWYTGAGIYRDVYMLKSGMVHIEPHGVKISTSEITNTGSVVVACTTLKNDSAAGMVIIWVETKLLDAYGTCVASDKAPVSVYRGETAVLRQRMYVHEPNLWDVDSPNLYTCQTHILDDDGILVDQEIVSFGIRALSLDPKNGFSINGTPTKLRGACIHHDGGPLGAATFEQAELRRIRILKEAGFNSVRMSHHPAASALLRACDKLGMLVMDEYSDMWTEAKCNDDYANDFPLWWERDITVMVNNDYNHPCVIIYSIGNEIQEAGTPHGAAWSRKLAEKIRELDSSRYILSSINGMVAGHLLEAMREKAREKSQQINSVPNEINSAMNLLGTAMKEVMTMDEVTKCTAESFATVDIAGYNYMDSRYLMDKELFPNRIICGSETHTPDIDSNWRMVKQNSHVIGDYTWTGWDYLGEAGLGRITYNDDPRTMVYGEYPNLTAMTGDIDITGVRRPASYYREIVFGLRKEPYIAVQRPEFYGCTPRMSTWSWSDTVASWNWRGFEGMPVKVEVYSDADEVELVLNGIPLSRAPVGEDNRFRAVFETRYEPGEIVAIAYTAGKETGRFSLSSSADIETLCASIEPKDGLATHSCLTFINLSIAGKEGNVFSCDNRNITITLEGPCILAGFATGEPAPTQNLFDSTRTTYDGRALVVLRAIKSGVVTLKAEASGLAPVTIKFQI